MNYQSNQIIICVEQKCNFNREIKDWNNLQEHMKFLHDIMIKEKFQQKVKEQYDQQIKDEKLKYLNQLNDFLQEQENILNQQIKSLFQSIKTLCVEYLQNKIVLPQYNYTMTEQLKIYFHEIQILNPKQPLDFLFQNVKQVVNAAKDNFQNYETQIISIVFNDNKMIETPTEQQFEQKQFKKVEPSQQQQYDRNQQSNLKNPQQQNYDKQQEQQKQKDVTNFVINQSPIMNEEVPLRGYRQVQHQVQNQDRIRFQMPSETSYQEYKNQPQQYQQQKNQQQYYVLPKETNSISPYAPQQKQNQSYSFTKNNKNVEYVPKQQYFQYQYEQQNNIDQSVQKNQQVLQNNQVSQQNQQINQQFNQHEKNNQVQVEYRDKQQVKIEQKEKQQIQQNNQDIYQNQQLSQQLNQHEKNNYVSVEQKIKQQAQQVEQKENLQIQQNNQVSQQNQQINLQFNQHQKNNEVQVEQKEKQQVQVEQKEKQQVQQIEQKVDQDQKIQSIVKVQEKKKKFDLVNSDKQLKFKNRFTEFFCSFEQDAIVDGQFVINEDAKVGFYFSELNEETPYPIIEMGIMEVDQEGQKINNSKYFLENNEKETIFILDEEYWMEYESKNRVLKYRLKNNNRQINIQKGQYYKFYVRVCGLNVKIL